MFILVLTTLTSCVLPKKYNELAQKATKFDATTAELNSKISTLEAELAKEKDARIKLEQDTIKLLGRYKNLDHRFKNNVTGGTSDAARLTRQVDDTKKQISDFRRRIDEYEKQTKAQEIAINDFRDLVTAFIMSFPSEGIKMSAENDKIRLTIDDALLFEPGGHLLTIESADLISYIASFLARNKDIVATIVSNTDPSDTKADNYFEAWELSVKRSAEITREIFKNVNVKKENIIAAGRGPSLPVSSAKDELSKSKNRRTDIILTKSTRIL